MTMKAVICKTLGPAENLVVEEVPASRGGPGTDDRPAIRAAGLNFFDTLIIAGKYQFGRRRHFRPAAEVPARDQGGG